MEGVEVPAISAQVAIQPSNPATATIQIIPTDSALLFLPRTLVHLFFLDDELTDADRRLADKLNENKVDRFDVEDERYRLLFAGEVIGYNYSKDPSSRSMVLQCIDLSSYWDCCYQWFADYSVGGSGLTDRTHNFVGAGQGLFDNVASGTKWVIGNILASKPENPAYREVKGLLAGLIHLLESIGGVRPHKKTYQGIRGVNDFFTIAELKYNLTGMVGAIEADTTSSKMYAAKAFQDWLKNGMTSAGSLISYRDVIRLVGQYIFHDAYPNPAAMFTSGTTETKKFFASSYVETELGTEITKKIKEGLASSEAAADQLSAVIPDDNGQVSISVADSLDLLLNCTKNLGDAAELLKRSSAADAARIRTLVDSATLAVGVVIVTLRGGARVSASANTLTGPEALFTAQVSGLDNAKAALNAALKSRSSRKVATERTTFTGDHLFNQLILPETFFMVPPRCNVIFPDQVTSFNFSRNYLREVTRLSCQGGLGIIGMGSRGAGILGRYYVAPNIRDVRGKIARQSIFSASNELLPHEIHSGIVPKFEWVTDGHRWGIKAAKAQGKNALGARISYVQRLANYQFFIHRWSARTMNCNMRFNPYIVLGFPGLVIDRSVPSAAALALIGETLGSAKTVFPTAYMGKVASVSHEINQGGGTTSVAFSHCRTHRSIDDEFLGVLQAEGLDDRSTTARAHSILDVDSGLTGGFSNFQRKLFGKFVDGTLIRGVSVDNKKVLTVEEDPAVADLGTGGSVLVGRSAWLVLGGTNQSFDTYRIRRGDSYSAGDAIALPATITVTYSTQNRPGKDVQPEDYVPPEIALRPGWYDPNVWANEVVSAKVFQPLLGTRAITDDEAISDPTQFKDMVNEMFKIIGEGPTAAIVEGENGELKLVVNDVTITTFDLSRTIDPATGETPASTSEQAIDGLTLLYGLIKQRGLDSNEFIRDYIKRPIATLPQVLGSSGISFENGELSAADVDAGKQEGFHSRAFGDYNTGVKHRLDTREGTAAPRAGLNALANLIPEDQKAAFLAGGNVADRKAKLGPIPPYLDPRGRARARVLSYAKELELSRGLTAT